MAIDKEILDRLDRLENAVANKLGDLELKINKLNREINPWSNQVPPDIEIAEMELKRKIDELDKSSDPYRLNKIYELQLEFNKKYGVIKTPKTNSWDSPNLDHYYEDGMPRLDKYLAYLSIDRGEGKRDLFLLTKDCKISYTSENICRDERTWITISGLVDVDGLIERKLIQITAESCGLVTTEVVRSAINELCNYKRLTASDIYSETKNEFRTIEIELEKEAVSGVMKDIATIRIVNTIYSTYGCMEENEPMWEDTIHDKINVEVWK